MGCRAPCPRSTPVFLRAALHGGALSQQAFLERRAEWRKKAEPRLSTALWVLWGWTYGWSTDTEAEGKEALKFRFTLGQALEQKGDTAGACAAYKGVLDRWGNAKPRSVTAEKARERRKALGCGP